MPPLNAHENDVSSWIPALSDFIWKRSELGAMIVDEEKKEISIATFGRINEKELKKCIHETINAIEENPTLSKKANSQTLPKGLRVKSLKAKKTLIEKDTCHSAHLFLEWRQIPWPKMMATSKAKHDHEEEHDWKELLIFCALCAICGSLGFIFEFFQIGPRWLRVFCYSLAILFGGWDAAKDVAHKIPKGKLDIHFLMLAVALGAVTIGALKEGALLLFLFSLSGALEHLAQDRTHKAIKSLFKIAPKTAIILSASGQEEELAIEEIVPGMEIIVKPGQLFPVDATILSGETAVDESNITGEATPIDKTKGAEVYSGTMNLWGTVQARVTRPAKESSLQKIINLIHEAQHLKAPSERFTDRFGTPYTYGILGLVTAMFFFWWLGLGLDPFINTPNGFSAFYRAMTLLVVASPCALVLSIPSAILAAIAWGASNGVLFRGGAAIEKLSEIDLVALDKTGTLTTGELKVLKIESFPAGREEEVLELAYSLEKKAHHPIAHAIVAYGNAKGLKEKALDNFVSLTGAGLKGKFDEGLCVIGRRSLLESGPLAQWAKKLPPAEEAYTEVWVVYKDVVGRLLLRDSIRKNSKPVLKRLEALGIKTVMLTGDRKETAHSVSKQLGIQEVCSSLKPEDKVEIITKYTHLGKKVAMVGDGVNDAPSLAAAYVPVAMGARGSDAALEQSEVILMNDRIENFLKAYEISLKAKRIIKTNLTISLLSIIIMVVASSLGLVPLSLGVLTHEGSTVFVCLNSLRLLYKKI